MLNLFQKHGRLGFMGIGALASIILFALIFSGNEEGGANTGLTTAYWLFFGCIGLAIVLPLYFAITENPKSLMKPLMAVGIIGGLFLISWLVADGSVPAKYGVDTDFNMTDSSFKMVGGALNMTWLLLTTVLGSIVIGSILKMFK